jgi:MFS family permease
MQMESVASIAGANLERESSRSRAYPWLVFAVIFGLLLSDYMSRQVLNAVFPQLKLDWALNDGQLGLLSGVVGLMVGLLAFPTALLADRWGRVKSVLLMAVFWSLSTLGCGLAQNYEQMLVARLFVGIGEAGYACVGLAIILSVFPPTMRATLSGAFTSAGMCGSVVGMAAGGAVAGHFGWRPAFIVMALFGFVLILFCALTITESRLARHAHRHPRETPGAAESFRGAGTGLFQSLFKALFGARTLVFTYLACGLQMFTAYSVIAWIPSYLNRYYALSPDKAGLGAAALLIVGALGMALCGFAADRVARGAPQRKVTLIIVYCLATCVLLMIGTRLAPGAAQLAMLGAGIFFAAGSYGPGNAVVTNLVHSSIHATALATLTLANNLIGAAPGPYLTGLLADRIGLLGAFQWIPLVSLLAALAFAFVRANYVRDLRRLEAAN